MVLALLAVADESKYTNHKKRAIIVDGWPGIPQAADAGTGCTIDMLWARTAVTWLTFGTNLCIFIF